MKCITCGNKITKNNSCKVDCKHKDRICRKCINQGRVNSAIQILIHSDVAKEINKKLAQQE